MKIKELMEQGKGNCLIQRKGLRSVQPMLIDRRPEIIFKSSHGDITADHQCQLVFGTDSKNCRPDLKCSKVILEFLVIFGIFNDFQLWCRTYNSQRREMCATRHQPWADGTRCGGNQGQGWAMDGTGQSRDFLSQSRETPTILYFNSLANFFRKLFSVFRKFSHKGGH